MIYLKQSNGVAPLDEDFSSKISNIQSQLSALQNTYTTNKIRCAAYWNGSENYYNIASSSNYQGTAWGMKIFDNIGLTYVKDTINYKHGFRLPLAGMYLITAIFKFSGKHYIWSRQDVLRCQLLRNGTKQAIVSQVGNNYLSCQYVFLNEVQNPNDLIQVVLQQECGSTVSVDCGDSYLYFMYLGTA